MTAEVNVIKVFKQGSESSLFQPLLLDIDDWNLDNRSNVFFLCNGIYEGVSIEKFVKQNGYEWIGVFLIQMLEQLEKLHHAGWVFGDLKNDNILIEGSPPTVRFIDVGGTTKIGRSIKEYSEFYDRAYWYFSTREANPSYDLFAVVMVILAIFYPAKFKRSKNTKRLLLYKLHSVSELRLYNQSLQKAIWGNTHQQEK